MIEGSGSGRPKNTRIRIRIRNTGEQDDALINFVFRPKFVRWFRDDAEWNDVRAPEAQH